jgi:hemerythrin-like domain-containing protein
MTDEEYMQQVIKEWERIDDDPEVDPTPDEYLLMIQHLSDDELIFEASADDINEFISSYT